MKREQLQRLIKLLLLNVLKRMQAAEQGSTTENADDDKRREHNRKKWGQNEKRWSDWKKDPANAGKVAKRNQEKADRKNWNK